ncbi:hypothetical protein ABW20_dc0107834 [Dactylellina cionopaga]|nr:hypothetical protein ABW20_dc0107834 [Dactylellina cionopaga]
MHFNAVLGPDWPIVYFTSRTASENITKIASSSGIWRQAVEKSRIQIRTVPDKFDLESRIGVNKYFTDRWLWEQLAPAQHVLIFQSDAILCSNAHKSVDDFLEWDFIGATLSPEGRTYNGGLSLRNRTMMLDILDEGNSYEKEIQSGDFESAFGEDVWYSKKMDQRGANLPDNSTALEFACEYHFHIRAQKQPLGYHKIHKAAASRLGEISEWCPEIALTAPGALPDA